MHRAGTKLRPSLARSCAAFAVMLVIAGGTGVVDVGSSWGAPSVSTPSGDPHNGQTFTITGTGFPPRRQDAIGLQILECADPGGSVARLPTDPSLCDGSTVSPGQVNTDAAGDFSTAYTAAALGMRNSNIVCDATHFCALWVGVDYNSDVLGIHAVSAPFEVGGPRPLASSGTAHPGGPGAVLWVALVIVAGAVVGAARRASVRRRARAGATS